MFSGLFLCLLLQPNELMNMESWEALATPWMTQQERTFYDGLSPREKIMFRGPFVARRLDQPEEWPKTGLFLPCFFADTHYGDIRDLIRFCLGDPERETTNPANPAIPSEWQYPNTAFQFLPLARNRVQLARRSLMAWEELKRTLIKHPEIRYDLQLPAFGRTRIPEDLVWQDIEMGMFWFLPVGKGADCHLAFSVPAEFTQLARDAKVNPKQHLELLLQLEAESGSVVTRHASQRVDLSQDPELAFVTHVPPGTFTMKVFIYSGFLPIGLKSQAEIFVPSPELPRIGTPIISQNWSPASIEAPKNGQLDVHGMTYVLPPRYELGKPGRVLLRTDLPNPEVFLRSAGQRPQALEVITHKTGWMVCELPAKHRPFQVDAIAGDGPILAFSSANQGGFGVAPQVLGLELEQAARENYLELESLSITPPPPLSLLYVNGQPYLASRNGSFTWLPLNWGEQAEVWVEVPGETQWQRQAFHLKRSEIYQEIQVRPKHIVAATRNAEGSIVSGKITLQTRGQTVTNAHVTPLVNVPKLWGIVVKDRLLRNDTWPIIRNELIEWLRVNTHANDLFYVVQIAHRPQLLLKPTPLKAPLIAAIQGLESVQDRDSVFNLQFLMDELTHVPFHTSMPHQVVMLTTVLTDEIAQMESMMPLLRETGLQIYSVEFPETASDEEMAATEGLMQRIEDAAIPIDGEDDRNVTLTEDFQSRRNTQAGYKISFLGKKTKQARERAAKRERAIREAFTGQLARKTAGMSLVCPSGQIRATLSRFFLELSQWQEHLVHIQLPSTVDTDDLQFFAEPGQTIYWTKVEWTP